MGVACIRFHQSFSKLFTQLTLFFRAKFDYCYSIAQSGTAVKLELWQMKPDMYSWAFLTNF